MNDGTGDATVNINTTNGAKTIAGTVDGAASGEGTLGIFDDGTSESDLASFTGNVGATQSLKAINIGNSTQGGDANFAGTDAASAVFNGTTAATTVTLTAGDAANETALPTFSGNITATTLALVGGGDATADATTAITMNDETGQTFLVLYGIAAQTISGTFTAIDAGEGDITVSNTGGTVTMKAHVGLDVSKEETSFA